MTEAKHTPGPWCYTHNFGVAQFGHYCVGYKPSFEESAPCDRFSSRCWITRKAHD